MKWGTFIAVDNMKRVVKGANQNQMMMEEYMAKQGIREPSNVIGPFETILLDRETRGRTWSDEELHEEALKLAREQQKRVVARMKALHADQPKSLIEHCAEESGFPIGSAQLKQYISRYYSND